MNIVDSSFRLEIDFHSSFIDCQFHYADWLCCAGSISVPELLQLGKARRGLKQKSGDWTEEKNAKMLRKMDTNGDKTLTTAEVEAALGILIHR